MCHKTGVNDLSLEIKYSDWLSRSGDKSQDRGHWPFVSHMTQTSSNFVSLSPLGERMSLHFWFFCWFFFLSHTSLSLMWESGLYIVSSNERIGQTERVSLYIVDSQQMGVFLRICADHKVSATFLPFLRKLTVPVNFEWGGNLLLFLSGSCLSFLEGSWFFIS